MTAFVVAVSPETASESVVDLAPRNFSRTAEPMETPATVLACERRCYGVSIVRRTRTGHVSVIQDDGATLVRAVFMAKASSMAFARLDADDQTPTAVPTTYPTASRRCYRYADGAATYYAACGEDEPFLIIIDAVAEYRGACVNEDAVDACLAAARCSIIDAEEVGPPDACGDAIKGRVHRV